MSWSSELAGTALAFGSLDRSLASSQRTNERERLMIFFCA
jgi:hypothetical protein